jgi:glycerol-3-phosphate acyltransferase PlsX
LSDKIITIAVDAMGGDNAPDQNIEGAVMAAENKNLRIILVGEADMIRSKLKNHPNNILIKQAGETIGMHEHPVQAIKKKTDSSLVVAANLVKEGQADALLSAGNTGASMTAGLLILGRLGNISRPAIATLFPTRRGSSLLLDAGATADCKPENLLEFARMGQLYMQRMKDIEEPTVGLLNIGEESSKGNFLALRAYDLLRKAPIKFYGNVEGRDLPEGRTDIVVCDGFTGNITLKLMEGIAGSIFDEMKEIINRSLSAKIGAALLFSSFKKLRDKMNPESYGGSPLLGVKGLVVIAHGRSSAKAIANAIRNAAHAVEKEIVAHIATDMAG